MFAYQQVTIETHCFRLSFIQAIYICIFLLWMFFLLVLFSLSLVLSFDHDDDDEDEVFTSLALSFHSFVDYFLLQSWLYNTINNFIRCSSKSRFTCKPIALSMENAFDHL